MCHVKHFVLVNVAVFQVVSAISFAQYSGGNGTVENPYQIAKTQDLIKLTTNPNHNNKSFILTSDIDLSGYHFNAAVIAWDTEPNQEGYQGVPFSGHFDGNQFTITHMTMTGESYLGLIGMIDSQAEVDNLRILVPFLKSQFHLT